MSPRVCGAFGKRPLCGLLRVLVAVLGAGMIFFSVTLSQCEAFPVPFVPRDPVFPVAQLRTGMVGEARTVVQGLEVVSFPVEIVDVLHREGIPRHLVLIRVSGPLMDRTGGIAAGMSGSPVYVQNKLVGAIGYGWEFSDHRLGLVTPVADMAEVWNWPERLPLFRKPVSLSQDRSARESLFTSQDLFSAEGLGTSWQPAHENFALFNDGEELLRQTPLQSPLTADGFSPRARDRLSSSLGIRVLQGGGSTSEIPLRYRASPRPGDSVGILLAWGDVTVGATGTLSAIDRQGRFVAFAHPMLNRGSVAYPLAQSVVHSVIPSVEVPFKLGTPKTLIGIVTQDRPQGVGGYLGKFAPAVDFSVTVRDSDARREIKKKFHVVDDAFLLAEIAPEAVLGILDDAWGRVGQGTAFSTLRIEGGGLPQAWKRENLFFSPKDPVAEVVKEFQELTRTFAVNEFLDIRPLGIHLDVEFTLDPRVLFVEDVELSSREAAPGQKIHVKVTLRPYQRESFQKSFTLTVPEDTEGVCEVLVRGGGIAEPEQESLLQGWRSIKDLPTMLAELSAKESNNELVVELVGDGEKDDEDEEDLKEEEQMLLSELREKRHKEGTLRTFRSNYYIEGLLRRPLRVVTPKAP